MHLRFKTIIPIPEQSMLQMLCYLLEVLLTPENTPPDCPKDLYELYFVFACIWAFGGAMFQDQVICVGPFALKGPCVISVPRCSWSIIEWNSANGGRRNLRPSNSRVTAPCSITTSNPSRRSLRRGPISCRNSSWTLKYRCRCVLDGSGTRI